MCGRVNVNDDPFVNKLMEALDVESVPKPQPDLAPGTRVDIVRWQADENGRGGRAVLQDAIWWLLLDRETLKPNYRYASFNSRSDKLNQQGSASYAPYRCQRCILPASGFVEGLGDKKTYFHIQAEQRAIAFAGVYKEWLNRQTGELVYSTSVITLPAHPKLKNIHPKSMPLMLPYEDAALIRRWLDSSESDVNQFQHLLHPSIRENLIVTLIDKPSTRQAIADSYTVFSDLAA